MLFCDINFINTTPNTWRNFKILENKEKRSAVSVIERILYGVCEEVRKIIVFY